ncbi:YjgB family protein [Mechercharimyces sp. CAU 1602]|nr:YjgB family protein [Mechercharimyces sp. CAU 1602]
MNSGCSTDTTTSQETSVNKTTNQSDESTQAGKEKGEKKEIEKEPFQEGKFVLDEETLAIGANGKLTYIPFALGTQKAEIISKWGKPTLESNRNGADYFSYQNEAIRFYHQVGSKEVTTIEVALNQSKKEIISILGKPDQEISDPFSPGSDLLYLTGDYELYFTQVEVNEGSTYRLHYRWNEENRIKRSN